ncbi:MAG TPA: MarR family winged helix-turn-helix transcriptional regulator [Rhizomicrobium sp.]|nr:MarR family winged helix-turn-helix transcriptional regulator [Rhizomicrobium sp.]
MKRNFNHKRDACDALALVTGYLYRSLRFEARHLGIRWTALMVLNDLALLGPSTQRTLADIEQIREPTMTVLLRDMRKEGWVIQERHPTNGRIKLAAITPKGLREMNRSGRFLRQRMELELETLSADDFKKIVLGLGPVANLFLRKIRQARKGDQA